MSYHTNKYNNRLCAILIAATCLLYSCTAHKEKQPLPLKAQVPDIQSSPADDLWNKHIVDTAVSLLKNGDIVLRTGIGPDSYLLCQMNQKDKTYSHCGIVMIENGYPFVYHSIGGEDNPDERLRRDSASFFFSPQHNMGLGIIRYDLSNGQIAQLGKIVRDYYAQRPRFDMKFDLSTDDQLYCSEFVYKALCRATLDTSFISKSYHLKKPYIGIDDLYGNSHATFIWKMRYK